MKRALYFIVVLLSVVALAGCVTVNKVVRERIDQDLSGNKGYVKGTSAEHPVAKKTTREYVDVKVEVPTWQEITGKAKPAATTSDTSVAGNRGYTTESEYQPSEKYGSYTEESQESPSVEKAEAATIYKVKSGDSLSRIAKKFYKKESKWTVIYEANKSKIKDPQKLKPGIELIIPSLGGENVPADKYIK